MKGVEKVWAALRFLSVPKFVVDAVLEDESVERGRGQPKYTVYPEISNN